MRPGVWILLCSLILARSANTAPMDESISGFVHFKAADVPYEAVPDIPELGYVVLSGDPQDAGIYVVRLKIPPGRTFPPHHHDQDRYITVISGVWAFGKGYSGKCEDTILLTAGAYVMHPKGAVHFDGSCGEETVEVQIIGRGPVKTTWIDGAD
jgi:quercetin dioxygenase-like cupin family protein